ncbi:ABC transporter [Croceicoccus hydrothermalis]|uniref:ABC transporter n=1 Tax=Croceicoccus hydrothermalis TaxID=2867964 RepID=UPI001EFC2D60|nr:ABC transporter [Croceicoccus hydrothermalis]
MRRIAALFAAFALCGCNTGVGAGAGEGGGGADTADATPVSDSDAKTRTAHRPALALFTSLPIFWAEGDIDALLDGKTRDHWAKAVIAREYALQPVDRLTQLGNPANGGVQRLFMAQPRALAGDENVALDSWVRGGGRLVLLADPMLEAHSEYGLGDRRRPEAMAMLSPILARWGLELAYDEAQGEGWRMAPTPMPLPISQAGHFRLTGKGHDSHCETQAGGLIARCRIGDGTVLAIADAALLQDGDTPVESAKTALRAMLKTLEAPL